MIGVTVLGSTGSIGESTLDVLARHPDRFRVVALAARQNAAKLAQQVVQWKPDVAVLADESAVPELNERLARAGFTGEDLVSLSARVLLLPSEKARLGPLIVRPFPRAHFVAVRILEVPDPLTNAPRIPRIESPHCLTLSRQKLGSYVRTLSVAALAG